jgi:spore maturation protein CgeB
MFDIYKSSKIILNDYPFNAKGGASNIRIKEVLSSGSLLLTRYSQDLDLLIEKKALVTFENEKQCLELIDYYLKNEIEREQIAQNGLELSKELFDSQKIMKRVKTVILEKYNQRK